MATRVKLLVPVILTAAVLAAPVLVVAPLSAGCGASAVDGACAVCSANDAVCCVACSGAEKSCCRNADGSSTGVDQDSGCGSCPLGQCDCCQSSQGLTLVCLPTGFLEAAPRLLAVPLLTTDSLLISRSDEPLLPPPIA